MPWAKADVFHRIENTYYYNLGSGTSAALYHYLQFNFATIAVRSLENHPVFAVAMMISAT